MVFPVPMEQAYNTLASYIRNAPLATSLTDPLAACTGLPDRSSNGAPERPLPPHGESAGDAKIDAKASKDESAASPTSGQSDSDGSFFGSTRSGSSSLSDAFRLFQEKMRISVQHHEASEAAGRGSAENADSLSSLNGREDPTVVTAQPDGPEGRVVGEQTSDGIAAPVRGGVCLSASGHVRRSSSVPPAAAKIEVPAEGDLSIGIHGCTSLPTAFPPRAGTDVSLRHPPMSRCFAMAAPASSDQLPSAAGSSVGDTSLRNSKTTGAVVGPLVDTQGRDGRLGLAAKAGLAQSQEMPTEITPISHFVSTRAPGSLLIRGGGLAGGRESSKPVAAAAVAAATAAQAAASATRRLVDAYKQLREENRRLYFMTQRMRTACILLLALSALSWFLRPTGQPFIGSEGFVYNLISWLYVGILTCAGWCLYSLCDWRSTQADVSSFVDIPHPLLSGSNSHQQQPNVRGLEIERRTDVRVGGMGDQSLKSGADYTSPLAAVPTVGKGDTSQKSVDRLQGEGKQESTTTESPIEDFDIERIPVSAESPPPPLNEWPQGSVLLRATEEEWIVNRVRALFAKEKKRAGLTNERSQRPRRPLPKICYPRPPLLFMSKELPDPQQAIHRFENPFFRGAVVVRLAPVGGTPGGEVYPDSKKRYMQACVQGQFLQPHKVGEVLTGQIFYRPLQSLPPKWIVSLGLKVVKQITSTLKEDIISPRPYFLTPAVCVAQTMHVAHAKRSSQKDSALSTKINGDLSSSIEGENGDFYIPPPDVACLSVPEDTRLLGGPFAAGNIPPETRKNMMGDKKLLRELIFSPDYIYTFNFFQNIFYPSTYEFDLGVMRLDLAPFLNQQPIELMALLDDAFIRDESAGEKETGLGKSSGPSNVTENERKDAGSSESGQDTKDKADEARDTDSDVDVSQWEAPAESWRFLWRYQFWHKSLLKQ